MTQDFDINKYLINIDDFFIGEEIESKGYWRVYFAQDKVTRQNFVIKRYGENLNREELHKVFQELTAPSMIRAPGIVPLRGFRFALTRKEIEIFRKQNRENELIFTSGILVTEYMPNLSLDIINTKYIKSCGKETPNFGPTERTKIIFGIAQVMSFAHSKNIIHQNLKITNILLDENFEPQITDFGDIYQFDLSYEPEIQLIEPFFFMAPEIISSQEKNFSSDVYAYGMILYLMFTSDEIRKLLTDDHTPINNQIKVIKKLAEGKHPPKIDSIPPHYWELIQSCWDQLPEDRPSFKRIVELLQDEKFMLEEFGKKTDRAKLHEYMKKMLDYAENA